MSDSRSDKSKGYPLRLSPELYEKLEYWAADEERSVNSLIVLVLRKAVEQRAQQNPELVGLAA